MTFDCVIVLYNCRCDESACLSSLMLFTQSLCSLHVFDNSTNENIKRMNLQFSEKSKLLYTDMKGNAGLAKAYNSAVSSMQPDTWIVLFDEDTTVDEGFFNSLEESISNYPDVGVHVPIVLANDKRIISPSGIRGHRIIRINEIQPGIFSGITAINTGMAINKRVFDRVGHYEEEIFLDYLDHYFIRSYLKADKRIAVFGSVLRQDFSENDHSNIVNDLKRFTIYKHDFYLFCKDNYSGRLYYHIKILYRAVKLSVLHKDPAFIWGLFQK